jgi:thiol:disulfide interchange protein DsbD
VACKEMEQFTFTDSAVKQQLKSWLLLRADVTANDDQDKELLKRFGVVAPPTILFFDKNGRWLKQSTIVGEIKANEFAQDLQTINSQLQS